MATMGRTRPGVDMRTKEGRAGLRHRLALKAAAAEARSGVLLPVFRPEFIEDRERTAEQEAADAS